MVFMLFWGIFSLLVHFAFGGSLSLSNGIDTPCYMSTESEGLVSLDCDMNITVDGVSTTLKAMYEANRDLKATLARSSHERVHYFAGLNADEQYVSGFSPDPANSAMVFGDTSSKGFFDNTGSDFRSTGIFVAPRHGAYLVSMMLGMQSDTALTSPTFGVEVCVNRVGIGNSGNLMAHRRDVGTIPIGDLIRLQGSGVYYLRAGDSVHFIVRGSGFGTLTRLEDYRGNWISITELSAKNDAEGYKYVHVRAGLDQAANAYNPNQYTQGYTGDPVNSAQLPFLVSWGAGCEKCVQKPAGSQPLNTVDEESYGVFTAPRDGYYLATGHVSFESTAVVSKTSKVGVESRINGRGLSYNDFGHQGVLAYYAAKNDLNANTVFRANGQAVYKLDAGDELDFIIRGVWNTDDLVTIGDARQNHLSITELARTEPFTGTEKVFIRVPLLFSQTWVGGYSPDPSNPTPINFNLVNIDGWCFDTEGTNSYCVQNTQGNTFENGIFFAPHDGYYLIDLKMVVTCDAICEVSADCIFNVEMRLDGEDISETGFIASFTPQGGDYAANKPFALEGLLVVYVEEGQKLDFIMRGTGIGNGVCQSEAANSRQSYLTIVEL